MSYDLEVHSPVAPVLDRSALVAAVRARAPTLPLGVREGRLAADGHGCTVEIHARGALLSAGLERGPGDEHLMELLALVLAGPAGTVIDRHTGRTWPAPLLDEWLGVSALLSGRALAVNEERITHRQPPRAAGEFATRVDALTRHAARASATPALLARLRDELSYYATRAPLVWPAARGLAGLGDFSRLEALAGAPGSDGEAFTVAAGYGAAALPMFQTALGAADPNHRRAAARALHRVGDPAVLPLIARALEDKRSTVREAVLEADFGRVLALSGARTVLAPVLARLANDPSSMVRRLWAKWA